MKPSGNGLHASVLLVVKKSKKTPTNQATKQRIAFLNACH